MDDDGISYTEREYDYAVSTGKVVLAFVHEDPSTIPVGKSDIRPEIAEALDRFRKKVMTGRLVKGWTTRQNLEPLVLKALIHVFNDRPQVGWIRGNAAASDTMLEQSNQLLQENARLKAKLADLQAEASAAEEAIDLAGLDDKTTIRYQTKWYSQGSPRYVDREVSLTWREIFVALASQLDTSKTAAAIVPALKSALKEAGSSYVPNSVDERDQVRIKVQLEALGLIDSRVAKSTAGTWHEFLSLTKKGRREMVSHLVARKE